MNFEDRLCFRFRNAIGDYRNRPHYGTLSTKIYSPTIPKRIRRNSSITNDLYLHTRCHAITFGLGRVVTQIPLGAR